jgi:hypothetical protein
MSMSKRFQVPVDSKRDRLYHAAAKKEGLSAAEWARRHLDQKAKEILEGKDWANFFTAMDSFGPLDMEAPEDRSLEDLSKDEEFPE